MRTVDIPGMKQAISHLAIRMREPLMFWGPSGCGKTQGADQASTENDTLLCDIRVSQYEGIDLRGLPNVQNNRTLWNLPATMPFIGNDAFPDDRPILLMFDEINSAQDDGVLAVCYQIIQEFRCGEHVLKPNVRIIAAGNRETDRGVVRRMPAPLANRFTHFEVVVNPEALVAELHKRGVPRLCLGFLLFRKALVSTFTPKSTEKVFASPRTWEKAFRYHADPLLPLDLKQKAISGAVGEGPAGEFHAYTQMAGRVITSKVILADPDAAPLPQGDGAEGMCWATVMNISGDMDQATARPFHRYLSRIANARQFGPEYAVAAWQLALQRDVTLYETDAYLDFAKSFQEVFEGR